MADGSAHRSAPLADGGPELAALLSSGCAAGRAFAQVLPELAQKRDLIAGHMPKVVKNSCGYRVETLLDRAAGRAVPLQKLFVGSEGTLGMVTEATLQLAPLPAVRGIAMAYFSSVRASGEAVPGILELGPSAVEIMDSRFLRTGSKPRLQGGRHAAGRR